MCISAGTIGNVTRSSTDVSSISSKSPLVPGQPTRHSSYVAPPKHRISGIFSREKSKDLPERTNISLYAAPRGKDKRKPLLTFDAVTQAFAVYPERPKLISSSTLIKLEGTYGDEDMCANMKHREGWMLLMPDLEGARSVSGEMLKWLIGEHSHALCYSGFIYRYNPNPSYSRRVRTVWASQDVLMGSQGLSLDDVCLPYRSREAGASQGDNLRSSF